MSNFPNNLNNLRMNQFNNNMNNPCMNMNNFGRNSMNNNMLNCPMLFPNNPNNFCFPNLNCQQNLANNFRASFNNFNNNQMNNLNSFNRANSFNNMSNLSNLSNLSNSTNNVSNINNMTNSGNENNFPFRSFKSEQINQKLTIEDPNKDININFRFINSQAFTVSARRFEKLKDVVKRFKKKECPEQLQKFLSVWVCHGAKVDQNKTLKELDIKDGEQILFMKSSGKSEMDEKDAKENDYKLTDKEKIFLNNIRTEYTVEILNKKMENLKIKKNKNEDSGEEGDDEDDNTPTFWQYLREKDRGQAIIVKEHKHKLVFCMTRLNWSCNICKQNYKKEDSKYFCSLCDFSMCQDCHEKGKYFMKKSFPQNTKPSNANVKKHFFKTDYHEHRLVYCRSSRSFMYLNGWICDNCREDFLNNKWSFYCTICDFDLCCDCCGYH